MGFDEWLSYDPAQNEKTCEVCEATFGEDLVHGQWVCVDCKEILLEEREEEE